MDTQQEDGVMKMLMKLHDLFNGNPTSDVLEAVSIIMEHILLSGPSEGADPEDLKSYVDRFSNNIKAKLDAWQKELETQQG